MKITQLRDKDKTTALTTMDMETWIGKTRTETKTQPVSAFREVLRYSLPDSRCYEADKLPKKRLLGLAQLRAPITPHLAEERYSKLGYEGVIDFVKWPSANEDKISARPVTYAIQVNGKLRSTIEFKKDATPEELEELKKLALNDPKVTPFLANRTVVKVITEKNKIVSIVVKKNS